MKHKLPRRHSMDFSSVVNRTFIVLAIMVLVVLNLSEIQMLSVSRSMAADSASSYFCKNDYYFQDNGSSMWLGNGANILGLSGKVDKTDFQTIANGCHPVSREQLIASKISKDENGQQIKNHRAGNDLTFSAPKAISIAYAAGVEDVKAAHDKAVQAVIQHIQEHYSQYRSPSGIQHADNLIAAKFDHITSRALDPQLHSHIFLINAVLTHEGDWKANETLNIFKDQKKLGLLYRQELANQLKILGYQIDYTDRKQMLYEIGGVDQANMDLFSKRRAAIEKQVAEWKNCNKFPDATDARLFEMANLNTRAAKDSSLTKNDIQAIWDKGFEEAGSSKQAVKAAIEACRLSGIHRPDKNAFEVVEAASIYLTETEAVFDRAMLLDTAVKISGGNHGVLLYRQELANQLQQLGYQIEFSDREQMIFELVGVDKSIIHYFSQRRVAIETQVAEWKASNKFPDASEARLFEMANLNTRAKKDNNLTKSNIQAIWYKRFTEAGTSKEVIKESIKKHRLPEQLPPENNATDVVQAAAAFLTATEAVIDRTKLLDTAAKISGGNHGIAALSAAIDMHSKTGIIRIGCEKGRQYYSTTEMQQLELRNLQSVKNLANCHHR